MLHELKYSVTVKGENLATQTSSEMHNKSVHYSFNDNGKLYMIQVFPNNKILVVAKEKEKSTIYSNVELTKIDDTTVDVNL